MKSSFVLSSCRSNWTLITAIALVACAATSTAFLSSMSSFKMVGICCCSRLQGLLFHSLSPMLDPVSVDRKISATEFGNNHRIHLPNDECEDPYEEDEEPQESEDSCREFVSWLCETFWNLNSGISTQRCYLSCFPALANTLWANAACRVLALLCQPGRPWSVHPGLQTGPVWLHQHKWHLHLQHAVRVLSTVFPCWGTASQLEDIPVLW